MERFKSREIERMAGVSKIQLVHWINSGAITPLLDDRRRGGVRFFSRENLFEVIICKRLNEWRLPVHTIAEISQHVIASNFFAYFKKKSTAENNFLVAVPFKEMDGLSAKMAKDEAEKRLTEDIPNWDLKKRIERFMVDWRTMNSMYMAIVQGANIAVFLKHALAASAIVIDLNRAAAAAEKAE